MAKIKVLFLDIGGVLLTNGWDHHIREKTLAFFNIDQKEFNPLHQKYYNMHEQGKISLSAYLEKTIFFKKRPFSETELVHFIEDQTKPHLEMLHLMHHIKKEYGLVVASLSNEGRELAEYRIKTFDLSALFDFFIISCFVGYQKPSPEIYKMAVDISGYSIDNALYIDDRAYLVEAARKLGLQGIVHTSLEMTTQELNHILTKQ